MLRERLVEVALEVLRLLILLAQNLKQNERALTVAKSPNDVKKYLETALERVHLDSVRYSSRDGTDQMTHGLLGTVAKKLRGLLN